MPETYIINPLSKESDEKNKKGEVGKEDPETGQDISLYCLAQLLCCIPLMLGSAR